MIKIIKSKILCYNEDGDNMIYFLSCGSVGVANLITILKNILNIIWIITPILAILFLVINLTKIMINPEEKKLPNKIKNILIALIIVFMIPTIVNAFMYMLDDSTSISSCWKDASVKSNLKETSTYQEPVSNLPKNQIIVNKDDYEKGDERKADNTTTISKLIEGAKKAAQHTYSNGYHYGDAHSWDGTNMKDDNGKNTVSCDRGVGLSLYYAGLTNTDPYKLTLTVLDKELSSKGWKKITNYNELQPGDIVYYKNPDGSLKHVFLIGEKINQRYDWGSNERIKYQNQYSGGMPFTEGISASSFYYAYRMQ